MSEQKESASSDVKTTAKKTVEKYGMNRVLLWVGAALLALGSFMDWASFGGFDSSGFDGRGEITFLAGIVVALVGAAPYVQQLKDKVVGNMGYYAVVVSALLSAYIVGDAAGDVRDASDAYNNAVSQLGEFSSFVTTTVGQASIGLGVWVVLTGGLLALFGAGMMKSNSTVASVSDVKKMSKANQKTVFVPIVAYLALFTVMYLVA